MGTANVLAALRALKKSGHSQLKSFSCNYNDVESKKAGEECLKIVLDIGSISFVEFVGNVQSRKFNKVWQNKFTEAERELKVFEDEDDDEDEDGEDEDQDQEDEDEDTGYETDLSALCEKLDQL